jgi:hypothetical protein
MPCLSGRFDPSQGILINLALAKPGTLVPKPGEPLRVQNFLALIDTGATRTCISRQAASAAGLIAMGKLPMVSATQTTPMDVYLADIVLPMGTAGFLLPNMQIMEFNCDPNCAFQVLLGRDILAKGVFTLSFDGHFSFSV